MKLSPDLGLVALALVVTLGCSSSSDSPAEGEGGGGKAAVGGTGGSLEPAGEGGTARGGHPSASGGRLSGGLPNQPSDEAGGAGGGAGGDEEPGNAGADGDVDGPTGAGGGVGEAPGTEVLSEAEASPTGLVLTDERMYWANRGEGGAIVSANLDGSDRVVLTTSLSTPVKLVLDESTIYWTNLGDGTVMKMPLEGGEPTLLAADQGSPFGYGLVLDDTDVYWTCGNTGKLAKVKKTGGAVTVIATDNAGPGDLVRKDSTLFWESRRQIKSMTVTESQEPTVLSSFDGYGWVQTLTIDEDHLYLSYGLSDAQQMPGSIHRVSLETGESTLLADGHLGAGALAIDEMNVYWANFGSTTAKSFGDGSIWRAPKEGGDATRIASDQPGPGSIAVNASHVYWTTNDGKIVRAPKSE